VARVAFIGLGVMGAPMAGHLARAGHDTRVYNRTAARAAEWAARHGGHACGSIAEAVAGAEFVLSCVSADADVAAVYEAAEGVMTAGALFIDHSTISARLARALAVRATASGQVFLDAPVSGGQAGAEAGRLTIMMGGDAGAIERARPVLSAYGANITRVGESGAGQLAKMVNQICIAGVVQGLAEGVHFAQAAGLDIEAVIAAVSKGAAQSWQMDNRWKAMAAGQFEFGFAVDLMRKDLGLVLDEARANHARLPLTALVDQFYAEVQAMGGARWDTSSLVARLTRPTKD
jgi:3-hydroxyisobutyrate dehydrogenase-like beta-hydroxyacid dehydrogenase